MVGGVRDGGAAAGGGRECAVPSALQFYVYTVHFYVYTVQFYVYTVHFYVCTVRCRIVKYLESFKARTSAWVTTASVLYADRLLNLDVKVDHEFYLSLAVQRIRAMFAAQIPKESGDAAERRSVDRNHQQILRVLVCGAGGSHDDVDSK